MIKNMNKKGAIFQDKTLNTILIILVIAIVFGFLFFKIDIKKWFNIVPDLNQTSNYGNETTNVTTLLCDEKVAYINKPEGRENWNLVKKDRQYIYFLGGNTNLFWDENNQEIKAYKDNFFKSNVDIGRIEKRKVIIFTEYLNENSEDYKKYKDILPSIEVLNSLNELYYFPGNYLCRTSIKIEEIKNE